MDINIITQVEEIRERATHAHRLNIDHAGEKHVDDAFRDRAKLLSLFDQIQEQETMDLKKMLSLGKLIGTDSDGWKHEARLLDDETVEVSSFSPDSEYGGVGSVTMETFLKNYSDVQDIRWKVKS